MLVRYQTLGMAILMGSIALPVDTAQAQQVARGVVSSWSTEHRGGKPSINGDLDWPMYEDPYLPTYAIIRTFHPGLKSLWQQALEQQDVETRLQAIQAFGRSAERGMPGLSDLVDPLTKALVADPNRLVRMAAAEALIRCDARQSSAQLLAAQQKMDDQLAMILLTDPVLAEWRVDAALEQWMRRLADPTALLASRISAIHSLQMVDHEPAAPLLISLVTDDQVHIPLRLVAASALGEIITSGNVSVAQGLMMGSVVERLLAVHVLAKHQGAESLLQILARDQEPAVCAIAMRRLLVVDPQLLESVADKYLSSEDATLRRLAAEAVLAQETPRAIVLLGPMLNDRNPKVRTYVRRGLIDKGQIPALRQAVHEVAMQQLSAGQSLDDEWRRFEQAARVLGAIDHEPAADRLIELLGYPDRRVRLSVGWALRKLALKSSLEAIRQYAVQAFAWQQDPDTPTVVSAGMIQPWDLDGQMAQLNMLFGITQYWPAEPLLRDQVPKLVLTIGRAAAVWSLGYFYEDQSDQTLASAFLGRLQDYRGLYPECTEVRRQAAIALGRMGAKVHLGTLQEFYENGRHDIDIGGATRWSVMRLTGVTLAPIGPQYEPDRHWFLQPLDDVSEDEYLRQIN